METNRNASPVTVAIYGPNLPGRLQDKGTFHVHRADCADCRKLDRGGNYRYDIQAETRTAVAQDVYGDQLEEGLSLDDAINDIYFAPCLKTLPLSN